MHTFVRETMTVARKIIQKLYSQTVDIENQVRGWRNQNILQSVKPIDKIIENKSAFFHEATIELSRM